MYGGLLPNPTPEDAINSINPPLLQVKPLSPEERSCELEQLQEITNALTSVEKSAAENSDASSPDAAATTSQIDAESLLRNQSSSDA